MSTSARVPFYSPWGKGAAHRWQWQPECLHGNTEVRPPQGDLTLGPLDSGWAVISPRRNGKAVRNLSRRNVCSLRVRAPGESIQASSERRERAVVQGWVFHWAQLQPQEVGFLPLKTADRLPREGSVTR